MSSTAICQVYDEEIDGQAHLNTQPRDLESWLSHCTIRNCGYRYRKNPLLKSGLHLLVSVLQRLSQTPSYIRDNFGSYVASHTA
jgi:hypothetical protein